MALNDALLVGRFIHDDIARQQKTNRELGMQGAVGQHRVAGAKNDVLAEVAVQLCLERLLHVDAVSTPKPSAFSAADVCATAVSKDTGSVMLNPYALCSMILLSLP
jgi:hypothetical protein